MDGDDRSFGCDTLKLRAVFIPEGNPNNVSAADITGHLGHDVLRIRAIFIPDGNPNNVTPPDITSYLGYDVGRIRYAWRGSDVGGFELGPAPDGPDGGESAASPVQHADGPGFTPIGRPAASAMPPTPALVQAPRYVDPAKTAVATWRATTGLSPPNQPARSRGADGKDDTVAQPDPGSAEVAGSSQPDAYRFSADAPASKPVPGADRRQPVRPPKVEQFFQDRAIYEEMARRLDTNAEFLMALSSLESGWMDAHNRALHNLFGVTHAGGNNLSFASDQEAGDYWVGHFGSYVRGAKTMDEFVAGLRRAHYNPRAGYYDDVKRQLGTVRKYLNTDKPE